MCYQRRNELLEKKRSTREETSYQRRNELPETRATREGTSYQRRNKLPEKIFYQGVDLQIKVKPFKTYLYHPSLLVIFCIISFYRLKRILNNNFNLKLTQKLNRIDILKCRWHSINICTL